MKVVSFILSIYMLLVSFVPCTDGMDCTDTNTATHAATTGHQDHQHEHEDDCPPFCNCSCCSIVITQPAPPIFFADKKPGVAVTKQFAAYQCNYFYSNLSAVWQPPRA